MTTAGAIMIGNHTPTALGDFAAGPSHVLPTYGSARFLSALGVDDFSKQIHVVSLDQPGLSKMAPHIIAIASAEGLDAHAESIRLRERG